MATVSVQNASSDSTPRKRKHGEAGQDSEPSGKRTRVSSVMDAPATDASGSSPNTFPSTSNNLVPKLSLIMKPNLSNAQTTLEKANLTTSPVSNSLSQTSMTSQNNQSPSTAPSSVVLEDDLGSAFSVRGGKTEFRTEQSTYQQLGVEDIESRSPSVASNDGASRSSARRRKPTSKAQALADAGTRFYKDLRKTSGEATTEFLTSPSRHVASSLAVDKGTAKTEAATNADNGQPEPATESPVVVDSIETQSTTPVRSSSRQRKPTAKVIAADIDLPTLKRTASPSESERPSKMPRIDTNTPREPSKLRQSLSSVDDSVNGDPQGMQIAQQTDSANAKADVKQAPITHDTAKPKQPEAHRQVTDADKQQSVLCDLSCVPPELVLLAFARYAANEAETEPVDDQAEGKNKVVHGLGTSKEKSKKLSKDVINNIIRQYCMCTKKDNFTELQKSNAVTNPELASSSQKASARSSSTRHSIFAADLQNDEPIRSKNATARHGDISAEKMEMSDANPNKDVSKIKIKGKAAQTAKKQSSQPKKSVKKPKPKERRWPPMKMVPGGIDVDILNLPLSPPRFTGKEPWVKKRRPAPTTGKRPAGHTKSSLIDTTATGSGKPHPQSSKTGEPDYNTTQVAALASTSIDTLSEQLTGESSKSGGDSAPNILSNDTKPQTSKSLSGPQALASNKLKAMDKQSDEIPASPKTGKIKTQQSLATPSGRKDHALTQKPIPRLANQGEPPSLKITLKVRATPE